MPRSIDHAKKKIEVYFARKNLIRENLDLRKQLAEIKFIMAQHYEARLLQKDNEIARLMAINRAERDRSDRLDMYLQNWVLNNPQEKTDETKTEI